MSKLRPQAPAQDQIEMDLIDALRRLQEGEPTNRSLKNAKKLGVLKITSTNVALEAGRSRTLIAMENCRYPRVRELIKQAKGGKGALPTTHTQLIQRLRSEIADLKVQKAHFQAEATAQFLARVKAEKEAAKERAVAARLRQELARNENITILDSKR